jgi:gliding motility-associatede transport system auxiliary component
VKAHGVAPGEPRIVLTAGGRTEKAAAPSEEELTNALVRLTHAGARKVYFTEGHGEPPLRGEGPDGLGTAVRALEGQGYEVAAASLLRDGEVPADATALVVAAPRRPLLDGEVAAVRRYLLRGGRLAVLAEPEASTGLEPVLAEFGMQLDADIVLDPSPAAQAMGGNASTPLVQPVHEHPITRSLAAAQLPVIFGTSRSLSPLIAAGGDAVRARPLLLTSPTAWGETDLAALRDPARGVQRGEDEKGGPMPVAMAAEKAEGGKRARVVVAGDADFALNGLVGALGNRDFFVDAVGWLAEDDDRITIRPRSRDTAVVFLSQAQAVTLAVISVDVVPVLLLGLGLAVWLARRGR